MAAGNRISALESVLLLILSVFAVGFFLEAGKLGETAGLFPGLVAEASLLLFAIAIGLRFFGKSPAGQNSDVYRSGRSPDTIVWSVGLSLQVGYLLLIVLLGFPLATLMYLFGFPRLMNYRRWGVLVSYATLLTTGIIVSFIYLFNIRLPEGLLWNSLRDSR